MSLHIGICQARCQSPQPDGAVLVRLFPVHAPLRCCTEDEHQAVSSQIGSRLMNDRSVSTRLQRNQQDESVQSKSVQSKCRAP
ncbi:uncharacterized protein PHALS_12797 [Plasmopara halstedii]|uniref:Uncharacterized protein n=1 Tax=Plasmopara halstedii TaxID=4781 RepID=A0A0P1AN55_PLAHL|nr:uncharacterized protein PHALS_12797 [Plasmopara halstedii]CEG42530.1 hypothetical protein PHALS_12797 [Plasmopara halstedii]|eukprot:XP_024578899.1 hypothetical protein PHALS_12797 [Plasmopara halstedii]